MRGEEPLPLAIPERLPVWETGERVVFPYAIETLSLPLPGAKPLLEQSHENGDLVVLLPASAKARQPDHIAAAALLLRMGPGAPGEGLLVVQGVARLRVGLERRRGPVRFASVEALRDRVEPGARLVAAALRRGLLSRLDQLSGTPRGLSSDAREFLEAIEDPGRFSDAVAAQLALPYQLARALLESQNPVERMNHLLTHLATEVEIADMQEKLTRQAREEMDKRQREYFLRQQLETIQAELQGGQSEAESEPYYKKKLSELALEAEVTAPLEKEIAKLARFGPFSEEASSVRAYLDLVLDLPWNIMTKDILDLKRAQRELDAHHYGLKKAKERILEHLAVSSIKGSNSGTIFCFAGPPGVGKTSLGRAIARALGRKFIRMSLGGVRDEAEIRGHRRTYVGAMPGRIIQGIKNSGSRNPVFVLDEVDKMGDDWRGDPSSALLEALDPEQNREFVDHYLGFPFNLSQVMFVATANTLEGVHPALVDRMEILELPGYTDEEKLAIALRHILPRQLAATGLGGKNVLVGEEAVLVLIRKFTREAGVRNLERTLETVLRKVARKVAAGAKGPFEIKPRGLERMLGPAPFFHEDRVRDDRVGVAAGLAWTEAGGEILYVEAAALEGNGALTLTGQLGDVMKESIQAALTYIKEHAAEYGLKPKELAKKDIHVHLPQGAIPKDGPSAGITMAVALISALSGKPVVHTTAFTGEITLRGDVLMVGGLREKLLAACRARFKKIVLPEANRHEQRDFPKAALEQLDLVYVKTVDEVFREALRPAAPASKPKR